MLVLLIIPMLILTLGCWPIWALAQHIKRHKDYTLFAGWDSRRIKHPDQYAAHLCKGLEQFSVFLAVAAFLLVLPIFPTWFKVSCLLIPVLPLLIAYRRAELTNKMY